MVIMFPERCEETFSHLSRFKSITRHMNRARFNYIHVLLKRFKNQETARKIKAKNETTLRAFFEGRDCNDLLSLVDQVLRCGLCHAIGC